MARQLKHPSDFHRTERGASLLRLGHCAYGAYWLLSERCSESPNGKLRYDDVPTIAEELRMTKAELRNFIFALRQERLVEDNAASFWMTGRQPNKRPLYELNAEELARIPERLKAIDGFVDRWREWIEYLRHDKRRPLTTRSATMQLHELMDGAKRNTIDPIESIRYSMRNQYQGLIFRSPKAKGAAPEPQKGKYDGV